MSHEIRTPMNAIIGLTHLMRRDAPPPHTAERLARVDDAARHLLDIINNILDLSKIESGMLLLERTDFSVDALLERTCGLVAASAAEKGLDVLTDADGMPGVLRGDPTRISQALANLVSNAVKFTEHGSITVRARVDETDGERVQVRFEVQDTGIGVDPSRLDKVFTAFEQADTTTTRRFGGTGLGLGITRELARLMGGDAGACSEPGVGSTFWFTARLEAGALREAFPAGGPLEGLHALVVDDLADARSLMAAMIEHLGLRAQTAASGEEALALAASATRAGDPYAVVLIDWLMPHMDGIETARRLLRQEGPAAPVCIMVSGLLDARMRDRALELGITRILQKPVSFATVQETLKAEFVQRAEAPVAPEPVAERDLRRSHGGARVLLAEDNLVNQEVARTLLEEAGLEVDLAQTGREAVEMASARHYELVLMDMQMPELDGLEAARRLRARPATAGVPIVAMTANAYAEDRAACLAAGMNDHLTKPVDPPLLYGVLARWLPRLGERARAQVNATRGLAFFGGKQAVYARALGQFAGLYAGGIAHADDPEALRRELHSIAGAASTLGAERIAADAGALGQQLRAEPTAAENTARLDELQAEVAALVAAIQADAVDQ